MQHVFDRVGHLARRPQLPREEAVVEHRAVALAGQVDALRDRDAQPLHAARQGGQVVRLHDHVDVRALHRKVYEPEARLLATAAK